MSYSKVVTAVTMFLRQSYSRTILDCAQASVSQTIQTLNRYLHFQVHTYDRAEVKNSLQSLLKCQQCKPLSPNSKEWVSQICYATLRKPTERSLAEALRARSQASKNIPISRILPPTFLQATHTMIRFKFMAVVIQEFPGLLHCQCHGGPDS
ncbi:hypothetical protein TWF225_003423 [Orbilia oligospora]|uniref:Uncharacterized protein n=1 Tax=Orbilia oligospora TaxID=2813651 RepID=A0A8H2E2B9_ORBOL|nr:hypothetical protein TWF225_003423 [Orbilia oligospora]KAF3250072.1 hypothetical protein TWF128_007647 [Orbilia oligospora]KAF3263228.1 hypothetical protein TWF217_003662 [Orbilia oligospora]TGJ71107.1 hypothetical protein EYR41_003099 [Orbilia oligospora]